MPSVYTSLLVCAKVFSKIVFPSILSIAKRIIITKTFDKTIHPSWAVYISEGSSSVPKDNLLRQNLSENPSFMVVISAYVASDTCVFPPFEYPNLYMKTDMYNV